MEFDGTEGGFISMEEAQVLTGNYRRNHEGGVYAHFFGREKLLELLRLEGAMGIRIYLGQDDDGVSKLVLLAADSSGANIENLILDLSYPCPPTCSPTGKP